MFASLLTFLRALLGIPGPWRFADLEVFGHRRHFGKVREIGWLGTRFVEVVDLGRDAPTGTIRYGAGAIFSFREVSEADARIRIEAEAAYRRRREAEDRERDERERREADQRERVTNTLDAGPRTREQILGCLVSAGLNLIEAELAVDGCINRGEIVEDPQGSGTYRLPTKEESDGIPF